MVSGIVVVVDVVVSGIVVVVDVVVSGIVVVVVESVTGTVVVVVVVPASPAQKVTWLIAGASPPPLSGGWSIVPLVAAGE